jgi:hypothetical protein
MNDTTDNTPRRNGLWKPGQSGNPAGRPRGSRNAVGEHLIRAIYQDFVQHGSVVIARVREERPHEYLKLVAGLLPKEFDIKETNPVDGLTNEELSGIIETIRAIRAQQQQELQDCKHLPPPSSTAVALSGSLQPQVAGSPRAE